MSEKAIAKKSAQVEEVVNQLRESTSTLFVDYLGLTVSQITDLRLQLYKQDCKMQVIKNNILKRASQQIGFEGLDEAFIGPSAAVFSKDQVSASKVLFGFAKEHKKLKIKTGVVDGNVLPFEDLKTLSSLPNKLGMISMLLSVLSAPMRNLACVVKAVSEKEETN